MSTVAQNVSTIRLIRPFVVATDNQDRKFLLVVPMYKNKPKIGNHSLRVHTTLIQILSTMDLDHGVVALLPFASVVGRLRRRSSTTTRGQTYIVSSKDVFLTQRQSKRKIFTPNALKQPEMFASSQIPDLFPVTFPVIGPVPRVVVPPRSMMRDFQHLKSQR